MTKYGQNIFKYRDNDLDIAYLLGLYLTDGYATKSGILQFTQLDKDICENAQSCSMLLFGKEPSIYQVKRMNRDYWGVNISSTTLVKWLVSVTDNKSILPELVFTSTREWKKRFISGCLDGDGWATFAQNRYKTKSGKPCTWYCQIGLVGKRDNSYISGIPKLLDQLGVMYKINYAPPRKEGYLWQTRILINPKSFLENELYFMCSRKQKKVISFMKYLS